MAAALLATALAACGSGHGAGTAITKTSLVTSDNWSAPAVSGSPSTASFCTLVVAVYRHEAELPVASTQKVREQILHDYIALVPRIVAAAPSQISAAAGAYFGGAAKVFSDLESAGLNTAKLKAGSLAGVATPAFTKASDEVISYTQKYCRYTIGG